MFVVTDNLLEPFGGDAPATQHVGEKRTNIRRTLRAAKRDDKYSIERPRHGRACCSLVVATALRPVRVRLIAPGIVR